ncbi:MAG: metabolite traffic protein EboE [Kiritimatiellae bacterium]|nr:metabolite traffic protein EboE [Kiritimatiellia bacterium]
MTPRPLITPTPDPTLTPFPLPYCLNVHDASTWAAVQHALDTHALAVKALVAPDHPFPLSLHLGQRALREATAAIPRLREWLTQHDCFIVALNAFPYGPFQGVDVKKEVYRPNWSDPARADYTQAAASFLARVVPEGMNATVTTVPGGWTRDWNSPADDSAALSNLRQAARFCRRLQDDTGRRIQIAIEPEPGCVWTLFDPRITDLGPEICWCLDTCHAAVEFQSMDGLDWTQIGRVQLSAAIECDNTPAARDALAPFDESAYLHQTRAALHGEILGAWDDLGPALHDLPALPREATVRTHVHVPLTWAGTGPLRSTRGHLTPAFFEKARQTFCEVETYTYAILPPPLHPHPLAESIAAELRWAATAMAPRHP